MANIKIPRKEFEKEIKITKEVEEKISLFGTPLESLTEKEVEIEVFPNRPDLLSYHGFLRGFEAFIGKSLGLKKYKIHKPLPNYEVKISPSVKSIRPFTTCAIIKNLKLDENKIKEIIDLQEKLHNTLGRNRNKLAIGIYPLEKIKLPIKYEARSPEKIKFIPLESDREMNGKQILQRHPTGKEYSHLLDDYEKYPIFIDSNNKILSMPPIINSEDTGRVSEKTKDVFVECSGHSLSVLQKSLNIIVTALSDMGGDIYQMNLHYDKKITTPDLTVDKMKISLENTNKLLGLNLKEKDLEKLLPKMGFDFNNNTVAIPAWRTDILHEVDLIEDVAIAYGYDKIKSSLPNISTIASESIESKLKSKISEIAIGLGLTEISTYHLIKKDEAKRMKQEHKILVEDSKTDYKILRPNLLTSALRILSENKDQDYPQDLFEIGITFKKDEKQETGIKESTSLLILSSPSNFTKMKQYLDHITSTLSISYKIEETTHPQLIDGRSGKISINNKQIGHLGEIHPETLRVWNIKMPVSIIEIELDEIFELLKE